MERKKLIEFLDENLSKSKDEKWNDIMFGHGWIAALMHVKVNFAELSQDEHYIPYQTCPKCNGQGIVSKPSFINNDVYVWTASETSYVCDVCKGEKIIPMYKIS